MKKLFFVVFAAMASLTTVAQNKNHTADSTTVKLKYSCPMHADVTSNKPGSCSKCGMPLAKSKKEQMKMEVTKSYVCPMHADVASDKPGKCSKCGMELQKVKQKVKTVKG